jgi:hypothetical protein
MFAGPRAPAPKLDLFGKLDPALLYRQPDALHDGRLLTLDDTVEFFNLVLGTKLAPQEKQDLVAFLRTL